MQRIFLSLLFALIINNCAASSDDDDDDDVGEYNDVCELYIAESTIPNSGLGIYSTIPRKPGDTLAGDICIPLVDMVYYNGLGFVDPFRDYIWNGQMLGIGQESESDDITAYWSGIDCVVNCHPGLVNVDRSFPIFDDQSLDRHIHPGAGAITPYHGGKTTIIKNIPAGGELFKYYGDSWFELRGYQFQNTPLIDDYLIAQKILFKWSSTSSNVQTSLYSTLMDIKSIWQADSRHRILHALPTNLKHARMASISKQGISSVLQLNATRSIEWLQQHGKCIDNIVPGASTIEGAGRGAFAKRYIAAGTTITGTPLLHVPFQSLADMSSSDDEQSSYTATTNNNHKQIFINYCFGNSKLTTMLLCPYGAGINYINHNQTRANVKIQWAKDATPNHDSNYWFHRTPFEFEQSKMVTPIFGFDYVATKNIQQGEEIFLDYGNDWEEAWNKHIQTWKPVQGGDSYVSAKTFNENNDSYLRTEQEQINNPYPENLEMRCHTSILEESKWRYEKLQWSPTEYGYPCSILARHHFNSKNNNENQYNYDVNFYVIDNETGSEVEVTKSNIPQHAISFVNRPYTTDFHLENTFRHELVIPGDMVPTAWKNLMDTVKDDEL